MLKKILSTILATSLLAGSMGIFSASAVENQNIEEKTELRTISLKLKNNITTYYDQDGNEVDPNALDEDVEVNKKLPANYDLRDYGRVTGLKDQNPHGTCWSFASTASMESSVLTQGLSDETADTLDFAESGNTWFIHTNPSSDSPLYGQYIMDDNKGTSGGNADIAANSISSGFGVYPENLIPYESVTSGYPEEMRFYSDYRLKEFTMFDKENVDQIKQTIVDKGALYISYNHFIENFSYTEDAQECYFDNGTSVNGKEPEEGHAVTLIGWDDNFSKDNFHPDMRPANDGAWLCKNSWGDSSINLPDDVEANPEYLGYFWISYENDMLEVAHFEMQSPEKLDNIYQHQVGGLQYISVSNSANIFTANSHEKLEQVCFANYGKADVKINVYKLNDEYTSPTDGELVSSFEKSYTSTGTHLVECPDEVFVDAGDVFSIVIEDISIEQEGFFLEVQPEYFYISDDHGKSFVASPEDRSWIDVGDDADISYAVIKAYTSNVEIDKSKLADAIDVAKNLEIDSKVEQVEIDDFNATIEYAESLLADENAIQNAVNNAVCVLSAKTKTISTFCFNIDSVKDYITFYAKANEGTFEYRQVELNTDLDLDGYTFDTPFTFTVPFKGIFNGNNHTIKNFKNNISEYNAYGGILGATINATVKDLIIENADAFGDFTSGAIAGCSSNTKFINITIKNSTSQTYAGMSSAMISGNSDYCSFIDCTLENVSAYSSSTTGLYTDDPDKNNTIENCSAKNYTLKAAINANDNAGCDFGYDYTNEEYNTSPILTLTDDECSMEEYFGELKSVTYNDEPVQIADNGKYYFERINEPLYPVIEATLTGTTDYGFVTDVKNKSLLLFNYLGTNTELVIPTQIYGIPVTGFYGDFSFDSISKSSLTTLTIPGTIKHIPNNLFFVCENLERLTIEEGVETIGDGAFASSMSLKTLTLPDSLKSVGEDAFINSSLTSVTLGKNVEEIGEYAFGYFYGHGINAIDGFVINGYSDTAAETYAIDHDLEFVCLDYEEAKTPDIDFDPNKLYSGDVNLDGEINIMDATLIQKYLADYCEFNQIQRLNADNDFSNDITIADATSIQKFLVSQ